MGEIKVVIQGTTPLLMKNPAGMMKTKDHRSKHATYNAEDEAEESTYKNTKGELYIPSYAMKGCILNASKGFKIKARNLSNLLAGTIRIEPIELIIGKKYVIDSRRVLIQGKGVIRHRAKINEWKTEFTITYDDEWLPNAPEILFDVVKSGGKRVGLLDYSPRKNGEFGTFIITNWNGKKIT